MRKFAIFYSLIAIGLITSARGDLTIEQRVEAGSQKGDVTVKVKGDKERIDAPSQPVRIIDGKKGEGFTVVNPHGLWVVVEQQAVTGF